MRNHEWGEMKPTEHQGQFRSECSFCGSIIYGSRNSKPNIFDLEFQDILSDCEQQLIRIIQNS